MSEENRELWKAVMQWLEIERKTQGRIAYIRRELSELCARDNVKLSELDVALY